MQYLGYAIQLLLWSPFIAGFIGLCISVQPEVEEPQQRDPR